MKSPCNLSYLQLNSNHPPISRYDSKKDCRYIAFVGMTRNETVGNLGYRSGS